MIIICKIKRPEHIPETPALTNILNFYFLTLNSVTSMRPFVKCCMEMTGLSMSRRVASTLHQHLSIEG